MNPSSPSIASRPNTSSTIQSAHAALTEKARENVYIANATKRIEASPERSLIKGAAHKRMQSLQTGTVRDLSNIIEGGSSLSAPKSPEKPKPTTPHTYKELGQEGRSPDKETSVSRSSTPSGRDTPSRDTPTIRPSLRRPPQSILGENTPPQSATMLALQNMASRDVDSPLSNVTNGSTALVRVPQTFDAISNQILSLTSIATSLQREMAQLSRRSKDNATDLLSLKEATNARDEDIRKSLRELVSNLSEHGTRSTSSLRNGNGLYLDTKAHNSPGSREIKPFTLPRIPSPTSFAASLDREAMVTPSSYNPDVVTNIALLEKIIRDMSTREGQDLLVLRLSEVSDRLAQDGLSTAKKLDELIQFIKTSNTSQALVAHSSGAGNDSRKRNVSFDEPARMELEYSQPKPGSMTARVEALLGHQASKENSRAIGLPRGAEIINEDILKIIHSVKDSVAQGGGLTAEVKALVRELRGEVLGMGREIGRKLDQANGKAAAKNINGNEKGQATRIVQEGLDELKQHMDRILHESRRQSSSSSVSRQTVDYQEINRAVRSAISEKPQSREAGLRREDIIDAVKEAWENYKPDIELQHFGLEREELLACLKEGIQEHSPQNSSRSVNGATREEVFTAVVEGLKHFAPPRVETEASLTKEEILDAVRECLEEFEFPSAPVPQPRGPDVARADMLHAVKEGLHMFDFATKATSTSRDLSGNLTRDGGFDVMDAGRGDIPMTGDAFGEQVLGRLREIAEMMKAEFRAVSDEARQNVSAHGRDTEQVLDATKDGFERLRADIEAYVDRAAGIPGKEDVLDSIEENFNSLREELEVLLSKSSSGSVESIRTELELLRESMTTSIVRRSSGVDKDEILDAIKEGLDGMRADTDHPRGSNESVISGTGEILDALHDGLTGLRSEVEKVGNKPVDMTVNYEILDTLKAGLEGVRNDIDRLREAGHGERAVAEITHGAVMTAESLKRNDIEHLEVLITQLRIKVEALESMSPPPVQTAPGSLSKSDLAAVEELLRNVHESVAGMSSRNSSDDSDTAKKEDVVAIETLLRNTKAKIDDMDPEQAVKKDDLDSVAAVICETRDSVSDLASHLDDVSKRGDINIIESLLRDVVIGLEEMKERAARDSEDVEKVTKTDVEAVEAVCLDVKTAIEQVVLSDIANLASKEDVKNLREMVKEFKGRIETHAENNAKAFDDRQAETVGVGLRVTEIKTFLAEFKRGIKEKIEEGATSVEALGKLLESLGETIGQNANLTDDIEEMFDTMKTEFEKSNAGVVGAKLEADEKFQQTWDKFDTKIDEKFNELMSKYDEAQIAAEAKVKLGEEKNSETEAALLGTKAVAEDLKLLIDTLGTTLTESVEKMDEASKTVFNRVEETYTRLGETHDDAKAEHQLTREQVLKTLGAIEGVQGHVTEYSPKILEAIKDILVIVGQHYEHSKSSTTTIQEKIAGIPAPSPPPDTPLLRDIPVPEKYDDAQVHEKLDKLVDHSNTAGRSFAQLDTLDKIHQKVIQTAAEVSEFMSTQTQRVANDHKDSEKAAAAANIAVEKCLAQKEHAEAVVSTLREEEDRLKEFVSILKAEQEDLAHKKMRLSADVSSLETALRLRREELHMMEARAEGLERRIVEGVIDHSRALLISKTNKGRDVMSRKRVSSHAASATGSVLSNAKSGASFSSNTQGAVNLAMGGNRAIASVPINSPAGASRRILSLNQITNNVPTGGFKRSHSVKGPGPSGTMRKSSWGGALSHRYGDLNKENLALKESEEDEDEQSNDGEGSDGGTMRRSSRGTTILGNRGVDGSIDEGTEWTGSVDGEDHMDEAAGVVLYEPSGEVA
jgi:hypothetical protein